IFYLPQLTSDYSGTGIEYQYFKVETAGNTEITVDDIEVGSGTVRQYYVVPVLSSGVSLDGTGKWNEVLEFVDESGAIIDTTTPAGAETAKREFETGDTKTVVSVSGKYTVTYDGKEHGIRVDTVNGKQVGEIEIKVQSNDFNDVELKYYERATDGSKGTQLSSAPVDAGEYIIEPVLTGGTESDYTLSKKQITFKIEPYTFDLSGVKWGYIDEVVVTDENGNSKTEEVEVAYDPAQGFAYRVQVDENGAPVTDSNGVPLAKPYTPVLIGLPKGDENGDDEAKLLWDLFHASGFVSTDSATGMGGYLTYTGPNTSEGAVTPSGTKYKVKYVFGSDENLGKNFRVTSLPTGLAEELEWIITPRKIAVSKNAELTYSGNALELLKAAGLDEKEVGVYYDILGLSYYPADDGETKTLGSAEITTQKHSGTYRFSVKLKDTTNFKWDDNGILKTTPQNIEVVVNKLVIEVTGWIGDGTEAYTPMFAGDVPAVWENLIKKGDEEVGDEWANYSLTQFTQTLKEKKANPNDPDNIEFKYPAGEEIKTFTTEEIAPMIGIKKPTVTQTESVYTGKGQSFAPDGLEGILNNVILKFVNEDGTERDGTLADFTQTNAGKYKIIVRLKTGYKWNVENNTNDLVVEFEIKKAQVAPEWKADEDGNPKAVLPGFENLGDVLEYHYYNENGEEVSPKDLKDGNQYRISVTLKEDAAKNLELLDDGAVAENGEVFAEDLYTHHNSSFFSKTLVGLPMWAWLIILLVFLLLLILLIVLLVRRKKKKAAEAAANAEKEEEKARREEERLEREEEKRRREEEREEERRRREEEREEERRRREEEREEERRRREEDAPKQAPAYGAYPPPPYPYAAPVMPAAMPMAAAA
ncbi:MAG: hypothetical protein K2N74_01125, partial [Clostridiales bacterium]|nr:hypothetical protein [Clostridiales bacterium]